MKGNMKTIKHAFSYKVGSGKNPIHLTVTVGEGQLGSSTVIVGAKLFDTMKFFDQQIGAASEVGGQKLVVVSVVSDTNKSTNRTSISYELSGGAQPFEHTAELSVDADGGSVSYLAEIELMP